MATITAELTTEPDLVIEGSSATIRVRVTDDSISTILLEGVDGGLVTIDQPGGEPDEEGVISETGPYGDYTFTLYDDTLIDTTRSLKISKINGSTNLSGHTFTTPLITYNVVDNPQTDGFDLSGVKDHFNEEDGYQYFKWTLKLETPLQFDLNVTLYWGDKITIKAGELEGSVINYNAYEAVVSYSPNPIFEKIKDRWWHPVTFKE